MDADEKVTELASAEGNSMTWTVDNDVVDMYIVVSAWRYEQTDKITKSIEFTLTAETKLPDIWDVVTEVKPGVEYIFAGTGKNKTTGNDQDFIMNTYDSTNNRITSSMLTNSIDVTKGQLTLASTDTYQIVTVEDAGDGGFYFMSEGKYFSAYKTGSGTLQNQLRLVSDKDESLCYAIVDFDESNNAFIKFSKTADDIDKAAWIFLFSQRNSESFWNTYSNHSGKCNFKIFTRHIPDKPEYATISGSTSITITSNEGSLWTIEKEYDADGNLVSTNANKAQSVIARTESSDEWQYAAAQGVAYTIAAPTTTGNYIKVQAKSVYNGVSSDVMSVDLNNAGPIAGIEGVAADSQDAPVEYYNLQGVRVSNPGTGLYIRRQGTKVEKVAIR
jgi:YD repeat-containing protein